MIKEKSNVCLCEKKVSLEQCWSHGVTLDVTQLCLKYHGSLYTLWQLELHKSYIIKSYIKHTVQMDSLQEINWGLLTVFGKLLPKIFHTQKNFNSGKWSFPLFHVEKNICSNHISFSRSFFLIKVEQLSPALQQLPDELVRGCCQPFCFPASLRAEDTTLGLTLCHCKMLHENYCLSQSGLSAVHCLPKSALPRKKPN